MGNLQAGSKKGFLAQVYAANGADVDRALIQMGGPNYISQLCTMLQAPVPAFLQPGSDGTVSGGAEGMFGGGESFVGGFEDLQNYGNSIYSKAKEALIRNIAEDVLTALKAKNVKNVRNAPIQDVVAHLTKALPPNLRNPRKFHENFNKSSSSQREVCRALGNAINKHYAGALIDVDGDESAMCGKIAEIMYSLLTGLHTEFMNVAGDVMRVMNNMQLANEYLERAYKKQKELIDSSGDPRLKNQSSETDKIYDEVKGEYNRQSAILANLINVAVGPTGKSLIQSLEDNRDFVGLVKNLRAMVGTQAFGDKLSYLLSGISSVAHSAELIDKALKKVGMDASDFKAAKTAGDLRSRVFKHIMNKNPSSKQLDEMMAAAKVIYEANYDHDAISKVLGKSGGANGELVVSDAESVGSVDSSNGDIMGVAGGNDDDTLPAYWQRKSLKKKIDNKAKYRELVLKDFRKQLRMQLQQVMESANEIARHIGVDVPADDALRYFVDAFGQVKNLDKENIHYALSGYPRDSTSKEQRELFLLTYDTAMKAAESLTRGPQGQLFKAVHQSLGSMVKLIDDFNDKMVKALTEIHIDRPEDVAAALKKTASTFYGSGDSGDDVFGDGNWVAFDKVKNELSYYFSIANVKTNLARSHDDLKSYSDDYEQILGEESAWIIDRIKQQYVNRLNDLEAGTRYAVAAIGTDTRKRSMEAVNATIAGQVANPDQQKASKENFKSLWTFQMNAKVNMVKVSQAIDIYLKAFTDGIASNPDSISSVVKMLNGVEIVAKWFNDRSGDQLASLFDFFPNSKDGVNNGHLDAADSVVNNEGVIRIPGVARGQDADTHYYAYLESRWVANHENLPGNPFLGRSMLGNAMSDKQCKGVIQLSQKVVKSMRALENILSAFVSVGSKFGDVDPLAKTFMNPGQIFNALCDYVAASAFTNEFAPHNPALTAAVYRGQVTESGVRLANANLQTIPTNGNAARYRAPIVAAGLNWSQNIADAQGTAITRVAAGVAVPPVVAHEPGVAGLVNDIPARVAAAIDHVVDAAAVAAAGDAARESVVADLRAARDSMINRVANIPNLNNGGHIADAVKAALLVFTRTQELAHGAGVVVSNAVDRLAAVAIAAVARPAVAAVARPAAVVINNIAVVPNNNYGILTGVADGAGAVADNKYLNLALSAIPGEAHGNEMNKWRYHDSADAGTDEDTKVRVDVAGWRDNFFDTDLLFQMVIKSIVAKVFTVVDAYRLFHRPVVDKRAHYSLNPLRTILGGADGGAAGGALLEKVVVVPEALELYYRLVLLAEWYRENFGTEPAVDGHARHVGHMVGAETWRVVLVPSIDGIWSDFVSVVFDKANYIKDGNYTETQCQRMILAINDIWKYYKAKHPKSTTRSILNAFVLEMNQAFGFLRQSDINTYLEERRKNLNASKNYDEDGEPFLDFDILNANEQFGSRPAPSDRFSKVADASGAKRKEITMMHLQKAVEDLRKRIDHDFLSVTQDDQYVDKSSNLRLSFAESLRNYRNDMANAKSGSDEYKVILRMMQSANRYINVSAEKMIMVHETIAAPLVTLYAVYKVMARFNAFCHGTSLDNLSEWNAVRVNGAAPGAPRAILDSGLAARGAYSAFLVNKYLKVPVPARLPPGVPAGALDRGHSIPLRLFTRSLLGNNPGAAPFGYLQADTAVNTPILCATLNASRLAKDVLAALLDFSANPAKLVTVGVSQNGDINVDASALEETCKDLLHQVKENIKKLRNNFNVADMGLVDKYEDVNTIGSTRWLEEHMIQQLFADRDECGLPRGINLLRNTFKRLTEKRDVAGGGAANNIGDANEQYASLDNAVRGLIFYENRGVGSSLLNVRYDTNITKFPGNVVSFNKVLDTNAEKEAAAFAGTGVAFGHGAAAGAAPAPAAQMAAFNAVYPMPIVAFEDSASINSYDLGNFGDFKSLMQAFNKFLHMYLYMGVEDGSNKFYAPLIESFATSAGSLEVMQNKAFPNVMRYAHENPNNNANTIFGVDGGGAVANRSLHCPPPGTVVYASNAIIIRSLLNSVQQVGTTQKKRFLFDTLTELPEYLKDRLRVNLPFFAKMFDSIVQRASLLKQLLNQGNLKSSVVTGAQPDTNFMRDIAPGCEQLVDRSNKPSNENTDYYNQLLTRLVECGHSMRKCAEGVYRELQDKPAAFFEMSKDFLQDYRTRNGGLPLMPFSSILTPLTCLEGVAGLWKSTDVSHLMLPVRENGSHVYKYNHATRLLLTRSDLEVNMDHFPGAKDIYNAYAASAPRNAAVTPQEYSNTIKHTFRLGKFLMDGAVYGRFFDQSRRNNGESLLYNSRNVFAAIQWLDTPELISDLAQVNRARLTALIPYALSVDAMFEPRLGRSNQAEKNVLSAALAVSLGPAELGGVIGNGAPAVGRDYYTKEVANCHGNGLNAAVAAGDVAHLVAVRVAVVDAALVLSTYRTNGRLSILPLTDRNGIAGVVELSENTQLNASKNRIAEVVGQALNRVEGSDRKRMRVLNILDAGIVPLNVHAFMREVPFANLLNYSYTFDRMVHDFILPSYISNGVANMRPPARGAPLTIDNLIMQPNADVNSTRELLVKLLVHPYVDLNLNGTQGKQYYALMASLFNGNDDMKLGRPRYLSDQLWHKALITSSAQLVAGQERFDNPGGAVANRYGNFASLEAGPAAYEAVRAVARYAAPYQNQVNVARGSFLSVPSDPVATSGLKIWSKTNGRWQVVNPAGGPAAARAAGDRMLTGDVIYCAELGRLRFDTKLVRNLVWFVQLQRIMRVVLTNHLSWLNTPVGSGAKMADAKITEFEGNEQFDDKDFTGENYSVL